MAQAEEEQLDPRIQIELEKLNHASEKINKLELELDRARTQFRQILTDSTQHLNVLSKKLGNCIDKSRPYYEVRYKAREAQIKTQTAALRYERACSQLSAAKEMVTLAEEGFFDKGQTFDPAWQEMLNHATIKVNDAETEKLESEVAHMETATVYNKIDKEVKKYEKEFKRNINKSRPYFEMKAKFSKNMEDQKQRVSELEKKVNELKQSYSESLKSLEAISAEIHQQRKEAQIRREMGERSSGVGEESPPPAPTDKQQPCHVYKKDSEMSDSVDSCSKDKNVMPLVATRVIVAHTTTVTTVTEMATIMDHPQSPSKNVMANSSMKGEITSVVTSDKNLHSSSTVIKRTNSYEDAVFTGVTEATRKSLTKKQGDCKETISYDNLQGASKSVLLAKKNAIRSLFFGNQINQQNKDTTICQPANTANNVKEGDKIPVSEPIQKEEFSVIKASRIPNSLNAAKLHELASTAVSSEILSPPDVLPESPAFRTNSELMNSLQRSKNLGSVSLLQPESVSTEGVDEQNPTSDTDSLAGSRASFNVLDDEQVQSAVFGFEEMEQFAKTLGEKELVEFKQMSIPAKLSYLEDYVKVRPKVEITPLKREEVESKEKVVFEIGKDSPDVDQATMISSTEDTVDKDNHIKDQLNEKLESTHL